LFSQVHKIPETFESTTDYQNSFLPLLFEETRADLSSSLFGVSQAPLCEIQNVEESIELTLPIPETENQFIQFQHVLRLKNRNGGNYKPESGDLIAFTHIRPKSFNDLNALKSPNRIAYVKEATYEKEVDYVKQETKKFWYKITVLSSKCMKMDIEYDLWHNKEMKLYAVYLMNITTNVRIRNALKSIPCMNIIKTVLGPHQTVRIIF